MPLAADRERLARRECRYAVCKEDADRHRTKVASHTETPLGVSKWLVWDCPNNISLPLGRRHERPLSLTYGKVLGVGVAHTSHFAAPKGAAVWLATIV